jgi:hypothetical protein
MILGNLGPEAQLVQVENPWFGKTVRVKYLDETNAEAAMKSPESFRANPGVLTQVEREGIEIHLRPYAIARIDSA